MKGISMIKNFFILALLLMFPELSPARADYNMFDEVEEAKDFLKRTSLPSIDYEMLDKFIEPGECVGAELEEKNWTFYHCKKGNF